MKQKLRLLFGKVVVLKEEPSDGILQSMTVLGEFSRCYLFIMAFSNNWACFETRGFINEIRARLLLPFSYLDWAQ